MEEPSSQINEINKFGGAEAIRTPGLRDANGVLSCFERLHRPLGRRPSDRSLPKYF
jgi:hypothetical protein